MGILKSIIATQDNVVPDNIFDCATNVIVKVATASVGKLEQLIGKDLRELVKSGKADKKELYSLAEDAYREVINTVSPEIMNSIKISIGDSELYIRNIIEKELLKLKAELQK